MEITLNGTDDISGIDEIKANVNIGEENIIYGFSKIDKDSNKYALEIYTQEFMYFKNLNISYIEAIDYAGNINKIEVNKIIPITDESRIINDDTSIEKFIEEINTSNESKIEAFLNNKGKIVDKEILKSIAGTDKSISFIQEDGTVWIFKGKDIKSENLSSVKLLVSNVLSEESRTEVEKLTQNAIFIKLEHQGNFPGKASVKIKVGNNKELSGKNLTLYHYNMESKQVEKIKNNIIVDKRGYATIEINYSSDYFLSEKDDLLDPKVNSSEENVGLEESKVDKVDKTNQKDSEGKSNNTINKLPNTGGSNNIYTLVVALIMLVVGSILTLKRKNSFK